MKIEYWIFIFVLLLIFILILIEMKYQGIEPPEDYEIFYRLFLIDFVPKKLELPSPIKKGDIPKKIFRKWCKIPPDEICGGNYPSPDALDATQKSLPDWEQIIYGDKEIEDFLDKYFGRNHKVTRAYYLIKPDFGVARADLVRFLLIYIFGGVYLDMKSYVTGNLSIIPFDKDIIISNHDSIFKPQTHLFENGEYQNWYIYARSGSPVIKEVIEIIVHNIFLYHNSPYNPISLAGEGNCTKGIILTTTGPIAFTMAINQSKYKDRILVDNNINKILKYGKTTKTKSHYSQRSETSIIYKNSNINYTPKIVYFTYHNLRNIPNYVQNNIKKYCRGFDIRVYSDKDCKDFLSIYYGNKSIRVFENLKGVHKSDFWRYCILYVYGGYYFDIKVKIKIPVDKVFDGKKKNTWYAALGRDECTIYNRKIATPPQNPIIKKVIDYIYMNNPPHRYHEYTKYMYDLILEECEDPLHIGENDQKNGWKCILQKEESIFCHHKKM